MGRPGSRGRPQSLSVPKNRLTAKLTSMFRAFIYAASVGFLSLGVIAQSGCLGLGGNSSSVRTAVVAGLVASGGGGITTHQAATFKADIRNSWAIAYDPADPPGCSPGGLWGPHLPPRPCTAYVLVRRKNRWAVIGAGQPGAFVPPERSPKNLGDPSRLVYLAP